MSEWKLVPVEPTPGMLYALWQHREAMRGQSENKIARAGYSAMLAASPSAPSVQAEGAKRLIGWRTPDHLYETTDPARAKNWERNVGVLPIFEGDPNTKLTSPPPVVQQAPVQPAGAKDWRVSIADLIFNLHQWQAAPAGEASTMAWDKLQATIDDLATPQPAAQSAVSDEQILSAFTGDVDTRYNEDFWVSVGRKILALASSAQKLIRCEPPCFNYGTDQICEFCATQADQPLEGK